MKRKKILPDPVLMLISILGITAFLLYWLKQNFDREEKSLSIKTEMAFRQTLLALQAKKLHIDLKTDSTQDGRLRIFINDKDEKIKMRFTPKEDIISTINVIRDKYEDSLKKDTTGRKRMVISMSSTSADSGFKDTRNIEREITDHRGDHIFRFLSGVDSLQDSIKVSEIYTAYRKELDEQHLDVPFKVMKRDSAAFAEDKNLNEVTIGFSHPVTYQLELGNTFPYLLKRISISILFSLLLLGITILSFLLLYKNLVKQQRLAALKNEFISNITHELKTPIATVGVAIEALKNFNAINSPERTREYLDISANELQRLSLLVDKVLKLSMFENKGIELKMETVDLKDITEEVVASLKLQLEKSKADIQVTGEGNLQLQGDKLHLLSVIFNLVDNALKYGKENPVIRIHIKEEENQIAFTIQDNGIGIPAEYKNKVFDKFFRVPHGDRHQAKGYGLGLSYVAQVIAKHNGSIKIESETGKGTTFTILIPKQQS